MAFRAIGYLATAATILGLGAGLSACSEPQATPMPERRAVRAQAVAYQAGEQRLSLPGTVEARVEAPLAFRTGGKVVARLVDVGAMVEPGTVIARLDDEDQRLQIRTAKAQLVQAEADLLRAQADLDRYERLRNSQVWMQATYDQRRSAADMARGKLEQMRGQLKLMENQAAYTVLTADAKGVVTQIKAEVGQVVQSGQAIAQIARSGEVEVVVAVPEQRVPELKAARQLAVTLWAEQDAAPHAVRLRELAPGADAVTRTYVARFTLLDPPAELRLGMSATLVAERPLQQPVAALPLTALFQQGEQPAVWLVDPQAGQLTLTPVTVIRYTRDQVLLAPGLPEGAMVVTAGVHKLDAGQRVRLLGAPKA